MAIIYTVFHCADSTAALLTLPSSLLEDSKTKLGLDTLPCVRVHVHASVPWRPRKGLTQRDELTSYPLTFPFTSLHPHTITPSVLNLPPSPAYFSHTNTDD